ncbi:MAG: hypothetical protein E6G10_28370 [Actinobacteria bacterium]|nr:MAG: hypothetical protein E6G10_28370 [Actinomycetota bacterium]
MSHSLRARPARAATALLAAIALAAFGLASAELADAAGSLKSAEHAVVIKVLKTYGAAGLVPNAKCKRLKATRFGCYYLANARTVKRMILVGNATVTYRGRRARVRLARPQCIGNGCPRRQHRG